MASEFADRTTLWAWIEQLAGQLAADRDLADAFERTPGKVAHRLGVPDEAIGPVLATLSRSVEGQPGLTADPQTPSRAETDQTVDPPEVD